MISSRKYQAWTKGALRDLRERNRAMWPKDMAPFDPGGAYYADIVAQIRNTGRLDCWDHDMPAAASDDSYDAFYRRNKTLLRSWDDMMSIEERTRRRNYESAGQWKERVAKEQAKWEAEQRARQEARQRRADREWRIEEERRLRVTTEARKIDDEQLLIVATKQWWASHWPEYSTDVMVRLHITRSCKHTGDDGRFFVLYAGRTYFLPKEFMDNMKLTPLETGGTDE